MAHADHYWASVSITQALAWTFLVLASVIVRYSWQDRVAGLKRLGFQEQWERWKFGTPNCGTASARVCWRSIRFLAGRTQPLETGLGAWSAGAGRVRLALALLSLGRDARSTAYIATAILLHTMVKLWLASEACRPLNESRRSGALELLLSTPLPVGEILCGQLLALKRQFGWAVAVVLLADMVMFLGGLRDRFFDTPNGWLLLCVAGVGIFAADLYTLAWVGMWLGLTAKKANLAARGALIRVLVLPWLIFLGLMTSTFFLNLDRQYDSENFVLAAWFAIGMLCDLYFYLGPGQTCTVHSGPWPRNDSMRRFPVDGGSSVASSRSRTGNLRRHNPEQALIDSQP